MRLRCEASVCGGSRLPLHYFMTFTGGPSQQEIPQLIPKNLLNRPQWAIVFETRACISYNTKFDYGGRRLTGWLAQIRANLDTAFFSGSWSWSWAAACCSTSFLSPR